MIAKASDRTNRSHAADGPVGRERRSSAGSAESAPGRVQVSRPRRDRLRIDRVEVHRREVGPPAAARSRRRGSRRRRHRPAPTVSTTATGGTEPSPVPVAAGDRHVRRPPSVTRTTRPPTSEQAGRSVLRSWRRGEVAQVVDADLDDVGAARRSARSGRCRRPDRASPTAGRSGRASRGASRARRRRGLRSPSRSAPARGRAYRHGRAVDVVRPRPVGDARPAVRPACRGPVDVELVASRARRRRARRRASVVGSSVSMTTSRSTPSSSEVAARTRPNRSVDRRPTNARGWPCRAIVPSGVERPPAGDRGRSRRPGATSRSIRASPATTIMAR